jgi:hypothetical protein
MRLRSRRRYETKAFLFDDLDHGPWRCEEYHFMPVEIAKRCGELDRVRLSSTYLESMGKDEDFHVVCSTDSLSKK